MDHLKMELRHWTQADAMELTSLCNAVDRRFLSNGLAYVQKCFPQWWNWRRWLGERAVLAMYAVLERLGYVAWCLSFVENHKKKGEK